jgi:hypothetical protein
LLLVTPAAIAFIFWSLALRQLGASEWRGGNFDDAPGQSSFLLIFKNLHPARYFSGFLACNLYNAFVFNFQWLYSLLAGVLLVVLRAWKPEPSSEAKSRFIGFIFAFTILNVLFVMPYHTFTIPRYSLAMFPCLFLVLSHGIARLRGKRAACVGAALAAALLVSAVASVDPVSARRGTVEKFGERFYALGKYDGWDGFFYNQSFLRANHRQNEIIAAATASGARWLVLDSCSSLGTQFKLTYIRLRPDGYPRILRGGLDCVDSDRLAKMLPVDGKMYYFGNRIPPERALPRYPQQPHPAD